MASVVTRPCSTNNASIISKPGQSLHPSQSLLTAIPSVSFSRPDPSAALMIFVADYNYTHVLL